MRLLKDYFEVFIKYITEQCIINKTNCKSMAKRLRLICNRT